MFGIDINWMSVQGFQEKIGKICRDIGGNVSIVYNDVSLIGGLLTLSKDYVEIQKLVYYDIRDQQ